MTAGLVELAGGELRALLGTGPAAPVRGIGVDVTAHARWRGDPRVHRLFTEAELGWCRAAADVPAGLAATWCVREAAVKALAADVLLGLRDVEVIRDAAGRPRVRVLPRELRAHGDRVRVAVVTADDASLAVAVYA